MSDAPHYGREIAELARMRRCDDPSDAEMIAETARVAALFGLEAADLASDVDERVALDEAALEYERRDLDA
jgi:hypothetical protein